MRKTISQSCRAPVFLLGLSSSSVFFAPAAGATDAPTQATVAHLTVSVEQGRGAESCPNARRLADEVGDRVDPAPTDVRWSVDIGFARERGDFTALVSVSGGEGGTRSLRAPGPGCAELARQVVAALVVLIDQPLPDARETTPAETPDETPANAPPPAAPPILPPSQADLPTSSRATRGPTRRPR